MNFVKNWDFQCLISKSKASKNALNFLMNNHLMMMTHSFNLFERIPQMCNHFEMIVNKPEDDKYLPSPPIILLSKSLIGNFNDRSSFDQIRYFTLNLLGNRTLLFMYLGIGRWYVGSSKTDPIFSLSSVGTFWNISKWLLF